MYLILHLGLTPLLVPSCSFGNFKSQMVLSCPLNVLSRDGCGFCISPTWKRENRLTVLGKMASIRRGLPVGPDYSTSIR